MQSRVVMGGEGVENPWLWVKHGHEQGKWGVGRGRGGLSEKIVEELMAENFLSSPDEKY